MRLRLFITASIVVLLIVAFLSTKNESYSGESTIGPINGVSLVSPPRKISPSRFADVEKIHANWVAIIPFGFSREGQPQVYFDHERQWWGERSDGTCELIKCSRDYNFKVLLKPHVWVRGQGWPGEYDLESEEDWQTWEKDYRQYILNYAEIADSLSIDMLCVGTEFRIAGVKREAFWRSLIQEVRTIYDGPLTYASNWDNFDKISFWDELDYIGVDAYFPLIEKEQPSIAELEEGWAPIKQELNAFSAQYQKPVIFTEYGYQSLKGTAGKHWEIDKSSESIDMQAQADAYQALFNSFWSEPWFGGGFFWKWHLRTDWGGPENGAFTPQGKTAEEVITRHFEQYINRQ